MSRKPVVQILVGTALIVIAILLLFNRSYFQTGSAESPRFQRSTPSEVPEASPLVLEAGSVDEEGLSQGDLDRIVDFLGADRSRDGMQYQSSAFLLSGETLVTEAYEAMPGEFVVSFVTPELVNRNGEQILRIGLKSERISLAGEISPIMAEANTVFEWPVGKRLNHSFVTNEGTYSLQITATDIESGLLDLNVRGRFRRPDSE
ncbi:MAG: hypothetical protein AAF357_00125 [Verrucomicrobiota bacterium]